MRGLGLETGISFAIHDFHLYLEFLSFVELGVIPPKAQGLESAEILTGFQRVHYGIGRALLCYLKMVSRAFSIRSLAWGTSPSHEAC